MDSDKKAIVPPRSFSLGSHCTAQGWGASPTRYQWMSVGHPTPLQLNKLKIKQQNVTNRAASFPIVTCFKYSSFLCIFENSKLVIIQLSVTLFFLVKLCEFDSCEPVILVIWRVTQYTTEEIRAKLTATSGRPTKWLCIADRDFVGRMDIPEFVDLLKSKSWSTKHTGHSRERHCYLAKCVCSVYFPLRHGIGLLTP